MGASPLGSCAMVRRWSKSGNIMSWNNRSLDRAQSILACSLAASGGACRVDQDQEAVQRAEHEGWL